MIDLLSNTGRKALRAFCSTPTLFAFDFDGTLTQIRPRPNDVFMTQRTRSRIQMLVSLAPVAVISGRGLSDLEKVMGFESQYRIGNHGMESNLGTRSRLRSFKKATSAWKAQLLQSLDPALFAHGLEIEDKKYSLSIHIRRSRHRTLARKAVNRTIASLLPRPRIVLGKAVINLVSPEAPNKGDGLVQLLKQTRLRRALYVGDDLTDEDVFSLHDPRILGARIGKRKNSHASYYLKSQRSVNSLLELLIDIQQKKRRK